MANQDILIKILARDLASPVLNRVAGSLKQLGAIAAAVGVGALARELVQGIQAAVDAASIQEAAEVRLQQAIRNTGVAVKDVFPAYKQYAAELQDATGVGDEVILSNQALLVSIGKLEGEGLQRATRASIDLGAALGVDAKTAFELVAKAASGYTSTLSRYGIIIDQNIPQSEKFEAALRLIEERFGGAGAANLNTYAGRLEELQGRFGDLQEVIGGPFRDVIETLTGAVLSPFVKQLTDVTDETKLMRVGVLNAALAFAQLGASVEAALRPFSGLVLTSIRGGLAKLEQDARLFGLAAQEALRLLSDDLNRLFGTAAVDPADTNFGRWATQIQEMLDGIDRGDRGPIRVDVDVEGEEGLERLQTALDKLAEAAEREAAQRVANALSTLEDRLRAVGLTTEDAAARMAEDLTLAFGQAEGAGVSLAQFFRAFAEDIDEQLALVTASGLRAGQVLLQLSDALTEIRAKTRDASIPFSVSPTLDEPALDLQLEGAAAIELPELDIGEGVRPGVDAAKDAVVDLADTVETRLAGALEASAARLGTVFVDAAFGADVAWKDFFANFMKAIAAAIAQALILKALQGIFPGLPFQTGGIVPAQRHTGGIIPPIPQRFATGGVVAAAKAPTIQAATVHVAIPKFATGGQVPSISSPATQRIIERFQRFERGGQVMHSSSSRVVDRLIQRFERGGTVRSSHVLDRLIQRFERGGTVLRQDSSRVLQSILTNTVHRYQFGGLTPGLTGIDNIPALLTPGELVLNTNRGQSESILQGRAAVVPADSLGGGGPTMVNVTINALDGADVERVLRRNPRAFGEAMRHAASRGFS